MDFLIGSTHSWLGRDFEVLDQFGDTLRVRYDDGREGTLNARIISQAMASRAQKQLAVVPGSDLEVNRAFFRTIGYLAAHTVLIEGFAPERSMPGFSATYFELTGSRLADADCFYAHSDLTNKWGVELRVEFVRPVRVEALEFGLPTVVPVASPKGPTILRVNSNAFVRRLFSLGFVLGSAQDLERIQKRIPKMYAGEFGSGYESLDEAQ